MAVKYKEQCKKCFHFQVCANILQNDLFIREVMLGEKEPKCKQFVEVVRCKGCHWWRFINKRNGCGICQNEVFYIDDPTTAPVTMPDDFCSYGERREGE